MKKLFLGVAAVAAMMFIACSDDSGTSANDNDVILSDDSRDIGSSESSIPYETLSSTGEESSAVTSSSSSSVISGTDPESSSISINEQDSTALDTYGAKCTAAEVGSTMNGVVDSANKYYCSANGWVSLTDGWSWDVPKEARLNPDVEYGTMTDKRDGLTYKTIVIGEQTWMAENLNYADSVSTPGLKGSSWCYENKEEYCAVTGRLYTWAAAIDSVALANDADNPQTCGYGVTCSLPDTVQGICPEGWHLPDSTELFTLFTTAGGQYNAGKILKSSSGWYSSGNGTDAYGFSALPAGYIYDYGSFDNAGDGAYFWSSTESNSNYAGGMSLYYGNDLAYLHYGNKNGGLSVRCLKN